MDPAVHASPPLAPVLTTTRLTLRPLDAGDRSTWLACARENQAFWKTWMTARPASLSFEAEFDDQLAKSQRGCREGTGYRLIAFAGSEIVAFVSVNNIVRGAFQNGTLGWRVTQRAEGQGLAFEAVRAVIAFCFAPMAAPPAPPGLGLHRVDANIMPTNIRSLALADRLGFRREGLARAMLNIGGAWQDHVMCALLADEVNAPSEED